MTTTAESREIQTTQGSHELSITEHAVTVDQIVQQVALVQDCMKRVMKDGTHYGTIPGTPKPTLYKAGADLLCAMFRLKPDYEVISAQQSKDVVSYVIRCDLVHAPTGQLVGSGIGACNSMETKYARQVRGDRSAMDLQNTILKMAAKRAKVDGALSATGAASMFTQDLEDEDFDPPARKAKKLKQSDAIDPDEFPAAPKE